MSELLKIPLAHDVTLWWFWTGERDALKNNYGDLLEVMDKAHHCDWSIRENVVMSATAESTGRSLTCEETGSRILTPQSGV